MSRFYYLVKPFLPRAVRVVLRRRIVQRQRKTVAGIWPIAEQSGNPPAGWPGWPEGKKFGFLLTHDVEGPDGLAKCLDLAKLERQAGFRSAFNFIPEGDYRVSRELREGLTGQGFEVGVHDLHHDGHLYRSRSDFAVHAQRINGYLKEWGAVGFRSAFMMHRLDWIGDLNVAYDLSTFDTDPFEPQPDGVGTIFPFWQTRPNGEPFLELPYTLPQDSTLFVYMQETKIEVWKRKLDWVAARGGMALVNVHPDYMSFAGQSPHSFQFPVRFYQELLDYVKEKYAGQYWHGTPRELAFWHQQAAPAASDTATRLASAERVLAGKSALVLLYSYYPSDPRPRRAAEALVNAGMDVELICLRQSAEEPVHEIINGVKVRRVSLRRRRDSAATYVLQYGYFITWCALAVAGRTLRRRYDLVHVHNMPDILAFGATAAKLRGARVILDLHDPMPELMRTLFGFGEQSKGVRLLKFLEKLSIGFVDQVITVNLACKRIFGSRSCPEAKIQVVMNSPDEKIFRFRACPPVTRAPGKPFVIMYHGSIVERHGLDLAVRAVQALREKIPGVQLRIYGARTPFLDTTLEMVRKEGLESVVKYLGPKSLDQIAEAIDESDLGVIPNRRSIFTELNTPTRIFEYLSRGTPVIAPRVYGITDYFGAGEMLFFELGDAADLTRQIEFAYHHPEEVQAITVRGQSVYAKHCWSREKVAFVNRVTELLAK